MSRSGSHPAIRQALGLASRIWGRWLVRSSPTSTDSHTNIRAAKDRLKPSASHHPRWRQQGLNLPQRSEPRPTFDIENGDGAESRSDRPPRLPINRSLPLDTYRSRSEPLEFDRESRHVPVFACGERRPAE